MVKSICGDCGHVFMAAMILNMTKCPKCGNANTSVARYK